jgi:predicted NACHT family NTPase
MEEIVIKIAEQFLEEGAKKVIEIKRKNEYKNLLKGLFKKPLPLDRDLNIGLDKVYVEPFYKKPLERENSQSLKINLWDLLEQQENQTKFLLVLGQPGSGKSSLVKKLASEWAEKNREPYPKEIFKYKLYVVQLRNLPEEFKEKPIEVLEKYLKSELGEAYKPYLWGEEVSYPFEGFNQLILLLDGLDEFVM